MARSRSRPAESIRRAAKREETRPAGAGAAGGGGYNFQSAVTAIAMAHAAVGAQLGWLKGLVADIPVAVRAETSGGGDDLRLALADGVIVEGQVKKGLKAGRAFDRAIDRLAQAISTGEIGYGLLILDAAASRTISGEFAQDVRAIGEGQNDHCRAHARAFLQRLEAAGLDTAQVCARLRVVPVNALRDDGGDVRAAISLLSHVCATPDAAQGAWLTIYEDAHFMVESRGERTREAIAKTLRAAQIPLRGDAPEPVAIAERLGRWVEETHGSFSIIGVEKLLPLAGAWLELPIVVDEEESEFDEDYVAALTRYHAWGEAEPRRHASACDALTLGRFRRLAVVVAGPGMGKTTLLRRLALAYATDGYPVLRVRALDVVRRMLSSGEGFEEAAFALGLSESAITPAQARIASLSEWVLLIDGLDECGVHQPRITEGLLRFAAGRSGCRVVATTRPIGYRRQALASWRHYIVPAARSDNAPNYLETMLEHVLPQDDSRRRNLRAYAKELLAGTPAGVSASQSPLLLSLCASLIARGEPIGTTRLDFYRRIFALLQDAGSERSGPAPFDRATLNRVLDCLGWVLLKDPTTSFDDAVAACARLVAPELQEPALKAKSTVTTAIGYWEALGVVERLRHQGDEGLSFVHLTFGEYAAGRFLSQATREQQLAVLSDDQLPRFSEAIGFAAALGSGDAILDHMVQEGFQGIAGQARLERSLDILAEAHPPVPLGLATTVLNAAYLAAAGTHTSWAAEVGIGLLRCVPRYATQLAAAAKTLLGHPYRWADLIGLRLALETDPDAYDLTAIVAGYKRLAHRPKKDGRKGGIVALPLSARERVLFGSLGLVVAELIVARLAKAEASAALAVTFDDAEVGSLDLLVGLERLVRREGLDYEPGKRFREAQRNSRLDPEQIQRAVEAHHAGYLQLLDHLRNATSPTSEAPNRPHFHLSGLFEVLGLRNMGLPELRDLSAPLDPHDAVVVFGAVTDAAALPRDCVYREAADHHRFSAEADPGSVSAMFDGIIDADPPLLNWNHAARERTDFDAVERMLRHPSSFYAQAALMVALQLGTEDDHRRLAQTFLASRDPDLVFIGATFALRLDQEEAVENLFKAAAGAPTGSLAYIIEALTKLGVRNHLARQATLSAALLGTDEGSAEKAAIWIAEGPSQDTTAEADLVSAAYSHWQVTERPYPVGGGTVPPSPRPAILRARDKLGRLPTSELNSILKEPRTELRRIATTCLLERARKCATDRAHLVDLLLADTPPEALLPGAFTAEIPYDAGDVTRLLRLLEGEDGAGRRAAMGLLDAPSVSEAERIGHLVRLRHDPVDDIREAAVRMLG